MAAGPTRTSINVGKITKIRGNNRDLCRGFFGALTPFGTQVFCVNAQRFPHTGTETIGLDQHCDQMIDILDAGA